MIQAAADTPIQRASIDQLTFAELESLVEEIQERRMRSQTIYQEALAAKAAIKEKKDRDLYQKRLTQIEKKLDSVNKACDMIAKYMNEVKLLRMTVGDLA
jgi:hypothetical protein